MPPKIKPPSPTLGVQLCAACSYRDFKQVENLVLEQGADVNYVCMDTRKTPLHDACVRDSLTVKIVKILIDNGANVHAVDKNGNTPLHYASLHSNPATAKLLIENGANVNVVDKNGRTPLHNSSHWGFLMTAKLLIENGANVLVKTKKDKKMPVDFARRTAQTVTDLVAMLEEASREQQQKAMQNMNDHNKINGTTTTVAASPEEPPKTTQGTKGDDGGSNGMVIWSDAAFDDSNEDEDLVPLHFAVKYSDTEILTEQLESMSTTVTGSDSGGKTNSALNKKDSQGRTALDLAALTGQKAMMKTLEKAGVSYTKPKARMRATAKKRGKDIEAYKQHIMDSL